VMPKLKPSTRHKVRAAAVTLAMLPGFLSCAIAQPVHDRDGGGDISVHYLRTGAAGFGAGAQVRERQSGLRAWSSSLREGPVDFRIGADYAYTRYAFDGVTTRARDLHHLFVPLQWRARDDRWLAALTPVVATSSNVFKDLVNRGGQDDFDLHLRLQVTDWIEPSFGWRAGIVRDRAFGSARFYPDLALLWRKERVRAELGVPSSRIDWQVQDRLALGAAVFPEGGSWHVISDERGGAEFDYVARAWRSALTANWRPRHWLRASAQAGVEFRRRYRFEDDTGARIEREAGSAGYWRLELQVMVGG